MDELSKARYCLEKALDYLDDYAEQLLITDPETSDRIRECMSDIEDALLELE